MNIFLWCTAMKTSVVLRKVLVVTAQINSSIQQASLCTFCVVEYMNTLQMGKTEQLLFYIDFETWTLTHDILCTAGSA